ncbi:DUF2461 domain-containing protein [Reyranella sp. CPCC 100927]|uniref:DUF2461 domain-containing protein n=1 Tax=Reyranella sp. CPCC 100927 TaxID=2599616 RepID=UPI0011B551EB|nr:DUF2461 domain-containing protein [Reyranella sp. CPCC 100927]TWT15510.1 DUF2461 domain-containing protein [Reyranella sp. CPCC 100927]
MVARARQAGSARPVPRPSAFSADTFRFLKALDFHQDRAWFQANRDLYEQTVRSPMIATVEALVVAMRRRKVPFLGDPKTAILRIHRDVRFTKDKRPYNAHTAMMLSRTGRRDATGHFYLQIDPKGSFVAAGFYRPEPTDLLRLRRSIVARPSRFLAMQSALKRGGLMLDPEDQLTRLPAGFSDVHPRLDAAVRLKSFFVLRNLAERDVTDRDALIAASVDFAAAAMPLMRLGWEVLT